ncbi:MAG: ABC transporter permease [Oscillospiraceae bacterium]|nr:ABC transporter permease [Oscillospiraceae bacterium]
MSAIFKRELRAYFTSPLGYFVLAIVFFFAGLFFMTYNLNGQAADLRGVFSNLLIIVLWVVLPVLTMRTFADDKRLKTDQALLTAPVKLVSIVAGKFLAAMLVFMAAISITMVYGVVIAFIETPDWLVLTGNFVGLLMLGGLVASIGILLSSLTESQFIAALGTFGISFLWIMQDELISIFSANVYLEKAVNFMSIQQRFTAFTAGIIRYDSVLFFLSLQGLFLFLTVRVLDSRRWN